MPTTPASPPNAPVPPVRKTAGRALAVLVAAAVTAAAAACGTGTAPTQPDTPAGTHIAVAVVPITDAAPFILAVRRGYFTRAGLQVTYTITPQSTAAAADLVHGSVNVIAAANYVSFLAAQAHGALNIRILAANSACGTDTQAVLALPGSGITKPADLAGKTIAVNVAPNIQTLTITRTLQADGVPTAGVRYVVTALPGCPRSPAGRVRIRRRPPVQPHPQRGRLVFHRPGPGRARPGRRPRLAARLARTSLPAARGTGTGRGGAHTMTARTP